jgi:sterol 3beta-glucosyltransferase
VSVVTSDDFAELVTGAGLVFRSLGIGVETMLQQDEWRDVVESGNFLKITTRMSAAMKQHATGLAERMPPLMEDADLVVTGLAGMTGVFSIADYFNIPYVQAYVFPITPTSAFAGPLAPPVPLGGPLNRLSFHAMRQMLWQSGRVADVTIRKRLGMPPASFWGGYRALAAKRVPIVYGYSEQVVPRPPDWDDSIAISGYWFLDAVPGWTPPDDLARFLDAGEPPVYIGFGSMGNRKPEAMARLALDALALSGQRGVLASGWGGLNATDLPDNVHMIRSVPHSWLFPRMAAVVHHGGAGTTAAGLRAGVPSIIIPFFGDQPFWGRRVAALGVGPQPLPRRSLTAQRLADAITQAVRDVGMRQRAAGLGARIRAEDGIGNATRLIERRARGAG